MKRKYPSNPAAVTWRCNIRDIQLLAVKACENNDCSWTSIDSLLKHWIVQYWRNGNNEKHFDGLAWPNFARTLYELTKIHAWDIFFYNETPFTVPLFNWELTDDIVKYLLCMAGSTSDTLKKDKKNSAIMDQVASGNFDNINKLTHISVKDAEKIITFPQNHLYLNGLIDFDPWVAEVLSRFTWWNIYLNGLKDLSEESAEKIAAFSWYNLYINGITTIAPWVAKKISSFSWNVLSLNWLESIDDISAQGLGLFEWTTLLLNWLKNIDALAAKALSESSVYALHLNGLTTIDSVVSWHLSKFSWVRLYLNWLADITDSVAKHLSWFYGQILYIDNLKTVGWISWVPWEIQWIAFSSLEKQLLLQSKMPKIKALLNGKRSWYKLNENRGLWWKRKYEDGVWFDKFWWNYILISKKEYASHWITSDNYEEIVALLNWLVY